MKNQILGMLCVPLLFSSPAVAQTTFYVKPGDSPAVQGELIASANSGDIVSFVAAEGHCYCCEVSTNSPTTDIPHFSSVSSSQSSPTLTRASSMAPAMPGALVVEGQGFNNRVCFRGNYNTSAGIITYDTLATLAFGAAGDRSASNVRVKCEDTSLFGKYNTSVTDLNFLELRSSQGNTSVDVLMTVKNSVNGQTVVSEERISVPADGRTDVDIHSRTGAGNFGTVSICPLAPKGSIKAELASYNVTSTSPFAFEPVDRTPFSGNE